MRLEQTEKILSTGGERCRDLIREMCFSISQTIYDRRIKRSVKQTEKERRSEE